MDKFIARYEINGIKRSRIFDKASFDKSKAEAFLASEGINNFFLFWEPYEPVKVGDNAFLFRGDIGFDITTEKLLPYLEAKNEIIFDSFGGDLWEGLKMYDTIKALDFEPVIGVLGSCASSCTLPLMATSNRWMSENSRFLVHNVWTCECGDHLQLRKTAAELEAESRNIAEIYARETGGAVEDMVALMAEERFLNAKEVQNFNFINTIKNEFNQKNDMDNDVKEKLSGLEKAMNSIQTLLNKVPGMGPKNIVVQDVAGVELDFGDDVETVDQIAVGATGVTANGEPAQGDYTLQDGTVYTFTAGTLDAIVLPASEDSLEEVQAENEALTAQVATLTTELANATQLSDSLKASLNSVNGELAGFKSELESLKSTFSGDTPKPNTPPKSKTKNNKRR